MTYQLVRVGYEELNARQKEAFNLQKVSAVLADYGYITIPLRSDWAGADFIAQHKDGLTFLKVQLKGRLTFDKKYIGRDLHLCFRDGQDWYIYPHDDVLSRLLDSGAMVDTESWDVKGHYNFGTRSKVIQQMLEPYRVRPAEET